MALVMSRDRDGRLLVEVRVAPRASRNTVVGEHDGALKIAVTAPPVEGAANEAVRTLLAKRLGVPKRSVEVIGGQRSKRKRIALKGVDEVTVTSLLEES